MMLFDLHVEFRKIRGACPAFSRPLMGKSFGKGVMG